MRVGQKRTLIIFWLKNAKYYAVENLKNILISTKNANIVGSNTIPTAMRERQGEK